jgi:hypothetical protein
MFVIALIGTVDVRGSYRGLEAENNQRRKHQNYPARLRQVPEEVAPSRYPR